MTLCTLPQASKMQDALNGVDKKPHPHKDFHLILLGGASWSGSTSDIAAWFCHNVAEYFGGPSAGMFLFLTRADQYLGALVDQEHLNQVLDDVAKIRMAYWNNRHLWRKGTAFAIHNGDMQRLELLEEKIQDILDSLRKADESLLD